MDRDAPSAEAQRDRGGHEDRFAILLEVASAVSTELKVDGLVRAMAKVLRKIFPHLFLDLTLADPDGDALRVHTLVHPENAPKSWLREGYVAQVDSVPGKVLRSRKPIIANTQAEVSSFIDRTEDRELMIQLGLHGCCILPLVSRGRAIGTLDFLSPREGAFDAGMVALLTQVAAQIAPAVDNALAYDRLEALNAQLAKEKVYLEEEIRTEGNFEEIVGKSKPLAKVLASIETVAATDSTVLIQGETGTGKELVARAIHQMSGRKANTFVKLNCAAIPTGLLESELFGHEKGAFTGAVAQKAGRFELANKGTLFLDEIGEISQELQPKLLRVLQDQEFERLGGTKTLKVDVRIIAATNRDLAQMVAARQFRSDLFYRLNVFPVTVPALRERSGDVPLLVQHFVHRLSRRMGKKIETIPRDVMEALEEYHWPGNIRELENFIERSVILTKGSTLEVSVDELVRAAAMSPPPAVASRTAGPSAPESPLAVVDDTERELIRRTLEECGWRVGGAKGAAAKLGISRTTLQSKMMRLGINRPGDD
jgi:formate hydrogenlyase transcriptional activator